MGSLSIGFVGAAIYDILPSIVREYRKKFPRVSVALHELSTPDQVHALHDNQLILDFASTNPNTIIRVRANTKTILYFMFTEGSSTCRER